MEDKYLWPLAGVLMGWLLSVLSGGWKIRNNRLSCQSKLVTRLIHIHSQQSTLISSSENFKESADNWPQFERLRARVAEEHFLDESSNLQSVRNLSQELSSYLPIMALRLERVIRMLEKSKDASFVSSVDNADLYTCLLSAHEITVEGSFKELESLIRKLSWRTSISLYVQVCLLLRSQKKNQKKVRFSLEILLNTQQVS